MAFLSLHGNPFVVVHPRVHRAHRLKSAGIEYYVSTDNDY